MSSATGESDRSRGDSGHQNDNGQNYITVIPVEYPRRIYPPQPGEFPVDQYRDHGNLYTVSQRFERDTFERDGFPPPETYERDRSGHTHLNSSDSRTHSESSSSLKEDTSAFNPKITVPRNKSPSVNSSLSTGTHVCIYFMSSMALHIEVDVGASVTVCDIIDHILNEEELALPTLAIHVFTIWAYSPLLEIQLKPHHKPAIIKPEWPNLLTRFTEANEIQKCMDEPRISFQRNVFFSKKEEMKISEVKILEMLYEEAKYNILGGRYPCEITDYIMLGSIQARLELGPYNPQVHTLDFFREHAHRFLPYHVCRPNWIPFNLITFHNKTSPEVRLLEQFHRIPSTPHQKLLRRYLEFCWGLPFYGSAFFRGQVEKPVKGIAAFLNHDDLNVWVAINGEHVYVIDRDECSVLLGLKYEDFSWDFAKPSQEHNPDCLPCLFLQFQVNEHGRKVYKVLQVFSKQAVMMDALISSFVNDLKQATSGTDTIDGPMSYDASTETEDVLLPLSHSAVAQKDVESCLSNKLNQLSLATFDEEGRCIGRMGSWSFNH